MAEPLEINISKSFVEHGGKQWATYENGGGVTVQVWKNQQLELQRDLSYTDYATFREKAPELGLRDYPAPLMRRQGGTNANGNTLGRVVGETAPTAVPATQANAAIEAETQEESITGEQILDGLQLGLDVVGLIPVAGEAADIISAGISLARGDYVGAGLSLLSAIPFVGYAGTAGKATRYGAKIAEASGKVGKEAADRAAKEAADKAAKEAAERKVREEAARKRGQESKDEESGGNVQPRKNSREKGKCGEWLASIDMINEGFDEIISVENNSGHGVDLIGRNSRTGEVKVWEVKTTDGTVPGRLSNAQKVLGGEGFTNDRLAKAARGSGNYGKVPTAMRNARKAQSWLQEARKKRLPPTYEKYDVFVDDLEKGCGKHPSRTSNATTW